MDLDLFDAFEGGKLQSSGDKVNFRASLSPSSRPEKKARLDTKVKEEEVLDSDPADIETVFTEHKVASVEAGTLMTVLPAIPPMLF